jgi:hypothetical protein
MQNLNSKIIAGFKIRVKKADVSPVATESDDLDSSDEDEDGDEL